MSTPIQLSLLRRTFAVLGLAGMVATGLAQAQTNTVTITDTNNVVRDSCTYSTMSITPSGGVLVKLDQCAGATLTQGTPTQGGQQSFAFEKTALSLPAGGAQKLKILRSGGTAGAFRLSLLPYGAACWGQPESVDVADGALSVDVDVQVGTVLNTYCEYTLAGATATGGTATATIGSNKTMRVTVETQVAAGEQLFAFEKTALDVTAGGPQKLAIVRTGGTAGSFRLTLSPYGAACWGQPETIDFADGIQSVLMDVNVGTVLDTYCEYHIMAVTATAGTTGRAAVGGNKTMRVKVSNPMSGVPTNCPAKPVNMLTADFPGVGNLLTQMQASGQVVSIKLLSNDFITAQIGLAPTPAAYSPSPVTIEYSVNECPGKIDLDPTNYCNVTTTNPLSNSVVAVLKPYGSLNGPEAAAVNGYCWAAKPGVQYYLNARWSYSSCMFSNSICGFHILYNRGPY